MSAANLAIGGICDGSVMRPTDANIVGTAFALSSNFALTAFHCVGSRSTSQLIAPNWKILFGDRLIPVVVHDTDPVSDLAVLRIKGSIPSEFQYVEIVGTTDSGTPFISAGWPAAASGQTGTAVTVSGKVVEPLATIMEGAKAVQLFCDQADSMPLGGLSGAPVLVDLDGARVAVGIIRWNPQRRENPELAMGQTIYAAPIATVLERWPYLRSPGDAQNGTGASGYCICYSEEDCDWALWIAGRLESNGCTVMARDKYLAPGDNYVEKISEAHRQFPDSLVLVSHATLTGDSLSHQFEIRALREKQLEPGKLIPVRIERGAPMPEFLYGLEPIDLFAYETSEGSEEALVNSLLPIERAPSRFPAYRFNEEADVPLRRSRRPQVTLSPDDDDVDPKTTTRPLRGFND